MSERRKESREFQEDMEKKVKEFFASLSDEKKREFREIYDYFYDNLELPLDDYEEFCGCYFDYEVQYECIIHRLAWGYIEVLEE